MHRFYRARPRRAALDAVLGILVLGIVWCAWTLWSTSRHLSEVEDQAQIMRAAMIRGDTDGARRAMEAYQDAADGAADATSGLTWRLFEVVPVLGDDAEGVALVSDVLADIGRDGLPPVADAADEVAADAFQPTDGAFPVDRINAMTEPARVSEAAFAKAAERLEAVDSSRFVGAVSTRFDELRTLVEEARATLESTYRASRLMPTLLGSERPSNILLVLQNNAEIRSTGGLPGAVSLVRAHDGRVDLVEQADMSDIGEQTADLDLPLSAEERKVFGPNLSDVAVNATLTPDIPRAAGLIRARWEQASGQRLDGVVFVDPVAVSYLMQGTGTVQVPGYPAVTPSNVVLGVENGIYLLTDDRDRQSDYQQAVSKAVFNAFTAGNGDTVVALQGLARAVGEGRIQMHFFTTANQAEITGTRIAGEFSPEATETPQVGIYLNDAGPTKMQYYLEYDASLVARSCLDDVQELAGSIEFTNNGTADLPPSVTGEGYPGVRVEPGQQYLAVYLTSPVGGELVSLSIEGQKVKNPVVAPLANRSVATIGVLLDPQETMTVEFVVRTGPGQVGEPRLTVTPGAFAGSSNADVRSSCTVR